MNNTNNDAAQAGAGGRGGGPAPRVRGRGSSNRGRGSGRAVVNHSRSKVGPNRLLEVDWTGEPALKVQSFTIWLAAGSSGSQQWTFHRPIGQTDLDVRTVWVATPTRDIPFLLARKGNEETAAWERQSQLAKRRAVLAARRGRGLAEDGQTEVWTAPGSAPIQETIRTCMAAALAAGSPESNWLQFAQAPVQNAERAFKDALHEQAVPDDWLRANPKPAFTTRGGPLGDQEQVEVEYLHGLSLQAAQDKVLSVLLGRSFNFDLGESSSPDEEEEEGPVSTEPAAGDVASN